MIVIFLIFGKIDMYIVQPYMFTNVMFSDPNDVEE